METEAYIYVYILRGKIYLFYYTYCIYIFFHSFKITHMMHRGPRWELYVLLGHFLCRLLGKLLFAPLVWLPWNQHSASPASWQTTEHSARMLRKDISPVRREGWEWEKWQLWYKGAKNGDSEGGWESRACPHACRSIDAATGTSLADSAPGRWPWPLYRGNLYARRNCFSTMSPICLPQNFFFSR